MCGGSRTRHRNFHLSAKRKVFLNSVTKAGQIVCPFPRVGGLLGIDTNIQVGSGMIG